MLPAVLEPSGVEVPAGVEEPEPEPEPEPGVVDPVEAVVVPVGPEPEAVEAEDDLVVPALLEELSLAVEVAVVLAGAVLVLVAELALVEVVRIGASEIGTPADEHWATTTFETASGVY